MSTYLYLTAKMVRRFISYAIFQKWSAASTRREAPLYAPPTLLYCYICRHIWWGVLDRTHARTRTTVLYYYIYAYTKRIGIIAILTLFRQVQGPC